MTRLFKLLKNKYFLINLFLSFLIMVCFTKPEIFLKAFSALGKDKELGNALFVIIGFSALYSLVVIFDCIMLIPANIVFNKFCIKKDLVYKTYLTIILFPMLAWLFLGGKLKIPLLALHLISSFILTIIFCIHSELKKLKLFTSSIVVWIVSFAWFTLLSTGHILLIALLAKWLFDLKNVILN